MFFTIPGLCILIILVSKRVNFDSKRTRKAELNWVSKTLLFDIANDPFETILLNNNMPLIYADFMKSDYENRLLLTCIGTHKDLEKYNISLKDGLKLVFYNDDTDEKGNQDDLVIEGIVEYDSDNQRWAAKINWDEITNISKLSVKEKQKLGIS